MPVLYQDWPKLDQRAVQVFDSFEAAEQAERDDWRALSPGERVAYVTYMRWLVWGDEAVTGAIQRVLEVVELVRS